MSATPPETAAGTPPVTAQISSWRSAVGVLLLAEALLLVLLGIPNALRFSWFAFFDPGTELTFGPLVARGFHPSIDFNYIYGLLTQLLASVWFGVAGRTPVTVVAAEWVCTFALVAALVRFARAVRVGPAGVALLVVSLPHLVTGSFPTLTHAFEPVVLAWALAEHARGNRPTALALVAAGVFVKPSMSYLYGLLLLILTVRAACPGGWKAVGRALVPAILTGSLLAVAIAAVYGPTALIHTLLPTSGSEVYRLNHFGFFHGIGRNFWRPAGASLGYYFGTVVGFWLAGTAVLTVGGFWAAWDWVRGDAVDRGRNEVVGCCALLHLAFVTLFFATPFSWNYYFYVLVMGLVGWSAADRRARRAVLGLAVLALVGLKAPASAVVADWRRSAPAPETAGLWASSEERTEWMKVRGLTRGRRAVVLAHTDGVTRLFPEFGPPDVLFIARGQVRPGELARKVARLATAPMVIVSTRLDDPPLDRWPEFAQVLQGAELIWEGQDYRVYRRLD